MWALHWPKGSDEIGSHHGLIYIIRPHVPNEQYLGLCGHTDFTALLLPLCVLYSRMLIYRAPG